MAKYDHIWPYMAIYWPYFPIFSIGPKRAKSHVIYNFLVHERMFFEVCKVEHAFAIPNSIRCYVEAAWHANDARTQKTQTKRFSRIQHQTYESWLISILRPGVWTKIRWDGHSWPYVAIYGHNIFYILIY